MEKEKIDELLEKTDANKYKKIILWIKRVFVLAIILIAVGFGIFYKIKYEVIRTELERLLDENTITVTIIEEKLDEIAELATAIFEYSGVLTKDNYREFFKTDINIPFTKNEVTVTYKGVIKVGYDLEKLEYKIENTSKKIYMSLPEARITDHYMILDELKYEQKNNVLNPISIEEINKYLVNVEKEELIRAEKEGIYKLAQDRVQEIIENYFAEFNEYEVIFM